MLASPANPIVPTPSQERISNLLTLHVSGADHDPVLLSPGKWSIGSAASNQIVLTDDGVEERQFLIVVTEHRSIIKDWCGTARWNGNPFDHAVLGDGDTIQVGGIQLSFRLAGSLDLISQLPCVADSSDAEGDVETAHSESLISGLDASPDSAANRPVTAHSQNATYSSHSRDDGNLENHPEETTTPGDDDLNRSKDLCGAVLSEREERTVQFEVPAPEAGNALSALAEVESSSMPSIGDVIPATDRASELADGSDSPAQELALRDVSEVESGGVPQENGVDKSSHSGVAEVEDRILTAERAKLRHYLEEFDAVDEEEPVEADANVDESDEEEDVVSIGAAQLATNYGVSNALRSRDEAVKRLDEMILAATQSSELDDDLSGLSSFEESGGGRSAGISAASSDLEIDEEQTGEESAASDLDDDSIDEADRDTSYEATSAEIEVSVENLGSLLERVDREELEVEQSSDPPPFNGVTTSDDVRNETEPVDDVADETRRTASFEANETALRQGEDSIDDSDDRSTEMSRVRIFEGIDQEDDDSPVDVAVNASEQAPASEAGIEPEPVAETNSVYRDDDAGTRNDGCPAERTPSWFDSEFMTEEDVAPTDVETLAGHSGSTTASAASAEGHSLSGDGASSTASSDDSSAAELRLKLAEMFDLPDLPERADSTVHDTAEEPSANATDNDSSDGASDVAGNELSSPWSEPAAVGSSAEALLFSENDTVENFESETLDHFPSTSVGDREATDEPDDEVVSTFEPEQPDADDGDDSINAYMERLLARNRQVTGAPPGGYPSSTVEKEPAVSSRDVSAAPEVLPQSGNIEEAEASKPESWFEATPRHRQNRDKVRAEVQVLRQIANQSARSAVSTASRRDIRKQVMVKTTASLLALTSGVAALLLDVSMLFGLVVLGIGLLFSADLTLTVLRNWLRIRNLRMAADAAGTAVSPVTDSDVASRSSSEDTVKR